MLGFGYSLGKSRRILRNGFALLQKKGGSLSMREKASFEKDLKSLEGAIFAKEKKQATEIAKRIQASTKEHFPKTFWDQTKEIVIALVFAIVVAFAIREVWFELYEVPTGSMRPTVEELDRMVVSKTTFGIHTPFRMKPFFFSEDLLKRAGIIVFTVEGMDVEDQDMLYFGLIPGKKRYIKRNMGNPGDTLYFYGGRIYGIDRDGNPITELADEEFLTRYGIEKIDHIPYITMDGKMVVRDRLEKNLYGGVTIKQMNEPVAKMEIGSGGTIRGEFFNGKEWIKDRPSTLKSSSDLPSSYSQLWGIGNYAMTRLLTKEEVASFSGSPPEESDAPLYLELRHNPNLTYPKPEIRRDEMGNYHPMLNPYATYIPLKEHHLEAIKQNLFTARFVVDGGGAYRYSEGRRPQRKDFDVKLPGVPNGTYEFYYGVGYQVHFGGILKELPKDHPLYKFSSESIQKFFNLGIAFNVLFSPMGANQPYNPQRFAYYRDGDLYVMGAPIMKKNDPTLIRFVQSEHEKQENATREEPYIAFVDAGPPIKEGQLDVEFIRNYGLKVPDDGVLTLGDNYAMSADSRDYGFTPVENLRGSPSFTFWPFGSRFGRLPQPPYPWLTFPNILVWTLVILIALFTYFYFRHRNQRPLFDDETHDA
ncbi:MAG: hypothetical protein K940chlam9_01356 [Chlamydiae bacterium]|nr:hypothetical protein [Chlamydiota bacterium]